MHLFWTNPGLELPARHVWLSDVRTWASNLKVRLVPGLPFWLSLAAIAASTWVSFRLDQSFAFTGFLHLVIVVSAAVYGGFWQATFISVVAATCLNYFFVPRSEEHTSELQSPCNLV